MKFIKPLFIFCLLFFAAKSYSQETLGPHYIIFIDSVRVNSISQFNPQDAASASQYTGKEATDILGEEAKDGIVYIETKPFSHNRYWKYFRSKSEEYSNLLPTAESDTIVQYIVNKRVLKANSYGVLARIDNKIFKSIEVIDKETLIKNYGVLNKQYGVIITCFIPKDVLSAKDKF